MSTEKDTRNLIDELETLQRVLDDAAGEQVDLQHALTQLNTVDEVPILSDLFSREEPPILRAVPPPQRNNGAAPQRRSAPVALASQATPPPAAPGDILEALHQEVMRKAASRATDSHDQEDDYTSALEEAILSRHSERTLRAAPVSLSEPAAGGHQTTAAMPLSEAGIPVLNPVLNNGIPIPGHNIPVLDHGIPVLNSDIQDIPVLKNGIPMATDIVAPAAKEPPLVQQRAELQTPSPAAPAPVSPHSYSSARPAPAATTSTAPATPATPAEPVKPAAPRSNNPFLPQEVIDRLTQERLAAQHSAEEAHRTMQRVMEKQQQRESEAMSRLSTEDKNQLINALVEELTPMIQMRLREKLRNMLIKKPE